MTFTIAVVGKGGVGKTTITSLIVKSIPKLKLVVDADCNANLNELLGVKVEKMIGAERDKIKENNNSPKQAQLKVLVEQCLVEKDNFDLLVMGRPEGKGCYCSANSMLKESLSMLSKDYPFTIIDCAAGMEHLSRLTINDIDAMLIVANQSPREIKAGLRIKELVDELNIKVRNMYFVINRAKELGQALVKEIEDKGIKIIGYVPEDKVVEEFDKNNKSMLQIGNSQAENAVKQILSKIGASDD